MAVFSECHRVARWVEPYRHVPIDGPKRPFTVSKGGYENDLPWHPVGDPHESGRAGPKRRSEPVQAGPESPVG